MTTAGSSLNTRLAVGLAGLGSLVILWTALCTVPGIAWNPPRLAPSYALVEGLNIYATRASGAHLGWTYGPVFALWGVPAALVPQITCSLLAWALLNSVAIFVPAWLVLRDAADSRGGAWQGLALFAVLMLSNALTQQQFFFIHVDGLCIGLGTLACWSLRRAALGRGGHYLHLTALAVILAIWTKQVAVSLAPGLFLWLWWTGQSRLMRPLFLWLVVYGGAITGGFFLWFGGEALLFNLWLIHAQTPTKGGWALLGSEILRMLWSSGVWVVTAALLACLPRARAAEAESADVSLLKLLACVAVCHLPLGLAAVLQAGGGLNSVHSLNYLVLMIALWLMRLLRPGNAAAASGVALWFIVVLGLGMAYAHTVKRGTVWLPYRGQEELLATARANAGRMYFPWNPLLTLITDKKIYPFDDALYCLSLAHLDPPVAAVRAAVPAGAVLCYVEPSQSHFALRYFPPNVGGSPAAKP